MDATPSHKDDKEKKIIHDNLKKYVYKIKKILNYIKNGVMNIFIFLIEKNQEELVEYFLTMSKKIGLKILSLLES